MLWACVLDFGGSWDTYLPLAELSYNYSYHTHIDRPPFEMLYGGRCWTLICWGKVGQRVIGSTEVVLKTTKLIHQGQIRVQTTQIWQESYTNKRQSDLEFLMGVWFS